MIKAIIFDADGPLYYRSALITQQKEALLTKYGYTGAVQQFEQVYEKEKFKAYVRTTTPAEMFRAALKEIGLEISFKAAERFTEEFGAIHQQVTVQPETVLVLKQLKQKGYKTCVLTDSFYSAEQKWPWFKKLGLAASIDFMVSSYDIRKLKDSPEAYRACLGLLDVTAGEALFVGQSSVRDDWRPRSRRYLGCCHVDCVVRYACGLRN